MKFLRTLFASAWLATALAAPTLVHAEEIPVFTIKDHKFTPEFFKVKAGERFKIKVINEDPTSEEFESKSMIIEKFIGPKRSLTITLGPLKPGSYDFFGCFHPQTAKGQIVAE